MSSLKNKTIFILSPQSWGKMFVSKHHYALELAKYGNRVYFLNPPDQEKKLKKGVIVQQSDLHPDLYIISHRLPFPYNLKFHFMPLFHFLMQGHVKKILRSIDHKPDIIWSFDLGNFYPFRLFPAGTLKIFHPVDEPLNDAAIQSVNGADIIFSVTNEILNKYSAYGMPRFFINHGLSSNFLSPDNMNWNISETMHIGVSGNLTRDDIDRETLLEIVQDNQQVIFDFWGSKSVKDSNLGGAKDTETEEFLKVLGNQKNVLLHGVLSTSQLAKAMQAVDAFLICYDVKKDQSKGTNYHKIIEYLSTGKVIISNNVSTYKDKPNLIQMVEERDSNQMLPGLFKKIVNNLAAFNSPEKKLERLTFAHENTYSKQLGNIEIILNNAFTHAQ